MEFNFTLQSALILLGAVVVLAIYLLSRRKYPREDAAARVDRALRANPPFIRSGDDDEDAEPAEAELLETPDFAAMDAAGDGNDGGAPGEFSAQMIEGFERVAQVDYWVKIIGARDVGREGALAIFHENAGQFTKRRGIHGLKMPDNAWRNLEDEAEGARFGDLVVTIQLADRQRRGQRRGDGRVFATGVAAVGSDRPRVLFHGAGGECNCAGARHRRLHRAF